MPTSSPYFSLAEARFHRTPYRRYNDELALHGIINPVALSPIKSSGTEVERYLSEPLLKKSDKKTYTEFWQGASTFYPILGRMARDFGTILSTSVPSESVFSVAGLQITK